MADSTETFGYDILDRVTSSTVASGSYQATEGFAYDYVGNLTHKGQKSFAYTGCAAGGGPHTICSVDGGSAYSYDLNGNMVAGNSRSVSYNAANKVVHIQGQPATGGGPLPTVDFAYGADRLRVVQSVGTKASATSDPVESARTVYVGMGGTGKTIYERTQKTSADGSSASEHVQFIYAASAHGGNAFALRVSSTTTQPSMRYQHFDHLGSVTASTDENGKVVGATGGADTTVYGYDVWGARRNPDGTQPTAPLNLQAGHREYTGHETIPSVGLVNMNGRVYDPDLGRFLSPDPNIQFVADLQSYNRYTYAANNPLKYTDPTGYFIAPEFDIRVGDPNNWSPGDAYARTSDVLTFDIASGGETHTWTIREATAATGHEFGILYYSDEGGNVGYRLFEANSTDPENIHYTWNKGETPLAWVHTHPSEVDSELMFSMRDVRDAFKNQLPTYAVSTNMPGFNVVVGKDILGYIPSTTSVEAGYVRQF
jgi:RHS repeat-associated protein